MPALLLVVVLLLAGGVTGRATDDSVPTAEAPLTQTALDVGHRMFRGRCTGRPSSSTSPRVPGRFASDIDREVLTSTHHSV